MLCFDILCHLEPNALVSTNLFVDAMTNPGSYGVVGIGLVSVECDTSQQRTTSSAALSITKNCGDLFSIEYIFWSEEFEYVISLSSVILTFFQDSSQSVSLLLSSQCRNLI
ncbi:hypothetical protein D3C79_996320 [compost metagenome]